MAEVARLAGDGSVPVHRLLVVDDDRVTSRVLARRLVVLGYQVESAASGEEALERLAQTPPDVMFLDVSMPGMSGLDVLERVRGQELDIAVIMMTAYGTEDVAVEALRRGADDYLRKPLEPTEFQAVLERTVERVEFSRQNAALRRQLDEKRKQLEAEVTRAARVQAELLPREAPALPGFELAARCLPASEVGGDFYDWQVTGEGTLALTIGDVMGKGMPAALLMATVRAALRAVVSRNTPAPALTLTGQALAQDLERSNSFITLFHTQLDAATGHLTYVDAGHGYVFVRRADGTPEKLRRGGLPLGILPEEPYEERALALWPGDALILYSDGLIDARPDTTLNTAAIAESLDGAVGAAEMVNRLIDLARPSGALPDDLTVVVLRRQQT